MSVVTKLVSAVRRRDGDELMYECQQCGARLDLRYYRCPNCGGYRVERADWSIE